MNRMLVATSIAALALIGVPAAASAADADLTSPGCFGQVHKAVNDGLVPGVDNVGQLVQSLPGRGQDKKALASGICAAG